MLTVLNIYNGWTITFLQVVVKYIPNKILYKKKPGKKYKTSYEKIIIRNK